MSDLQNHAASALLGALGLGVVLQLASFGSGPDESMQITVATPGRYFLMARSYSGAGAFTLTVELD